MNPLCVTTVVNEGYQEYIPLYLYFLLTAYPEYEAIIYFDGQMYPEVSECLEMVSDLGRFKVKTVPYRYDRSNAKVLKALRWVLYDDAFLDYESVYIGDIDMFVVREDVPLHEVHVAHSQEIGLPYSNRIRGGQRKLTGLHFVNTHAYYPRVLAVIEKYRDLIERSVLAAGLNNEELLYLMMEESVGLPRFTGKFVTHHGMHARAFHDDHDLAYQRRRTDFVFARHFEPYRARFLEQTGTPLYAAIMERLAQITYSPATLARYPAGGPAVRRQLGVILSLCHALEREAAECGRER